jgi:hypothetical protein
MAALTLRKAACGEILLAIAARVVSTTGLDATRVLIAAVSSPWDVPHHGAAQDILLMPRGEVPEAPVDGGGRYVNLRKRTLEVAVRTRLQLDTAQTDKTRLTDDSLGHLALEDRVCDGLENWFPLDADTGDAIATPLAVGRLTGPAKDHRDATWVSTQFTVDFLYERDLTLPEQ